MSNSTKPEIELIEVKDGVYVIIIEAKSPAVAVYWKHCDGATSSLMRPGKRRVDITKKLVDGKQLSVDSARKKRAAFKLIIGGLHETRRDSPGLTDCAPSNS